MLKSHEPRFFCISYFEGNLDLLKYAKNNYIVYFKGDENLENFHKFDSDKKKFIKNTGFNIATYLHYIIENYEQLPAIIIFCKNNVYPRHMSESRFSKLVQRNIFTPLVEPNKWTPKFPVSPITSTGDYLEIDDSWYAKNREGAYFNDFQSFYNFVFPNVIAHEYLRFTPGANFVVTKENVLNRTRSFYENLLSFIDYETHALESYFVERIMDAIFTSPQSSNRELDRVLTEGDLARLRAKNSQTAKLSKYSGRSVSRKLGYILIRLIHQVFLTKRY